MSIVTSLYEKPFDFPVTKGSPKTQYMVATTPRSGSTFFCMELWRTGVLGAPMEYPNLPIMDPLRNRIGDRSDIINYWEKLKSLRTSPNGVFGYKMFMSNYMFIGKEHPNLLRLIVPDHVIHLTRKDRVAQAVSYSKAIRSQAWFEDVKIKNDLNYDQDHIKLCEEMIASQENFWSKLFALTETKVLSLHYEDLLCEKKETLEKVAEFIGVELSENYIVIPEIKKQRNESSRLWKSSYERESIL